LKKTISALRVEENFLIDLTVHDFPADLLEEFALSVALPYFSGNVSDALKGLMRRAVADQEFVQNHTRPYE